MRRLLGAAAFALFERSHRLALRLVGATARPVPTSQGPVHVLDVPGAGPLPTVVLLHGLSSSAIDFAPLVRALRRHVRRVIALDAPGHGRSAPPRHAVGMNVLQTALFEALDQLRAEGLDGPVTLVGNSLGGVFATRYALRHPDATGRLVLVAPAGAPCSPETLAELRRRFDPANLDDGLRFVREVFVRRRWYERVVAWGVPHRVGTPTARALLAAIDDDTWLTPAELAGLHVPVLLLWGRQDVVLPPDHFEFFSRHLPPHAARRLADGLGHAPHLDDPDRLAADVLELST